ncbi:hypothetical protein ABVT39_006219 [Epinephelus coioides]
MTMLQPTPQRLPWQQSMTAGFNFFLTHPIHQTCPPSDFHLFPYLKKALAGKRFANDNDLKEAVEDFLGSQPKELFSTGTKALQHHQSKCVALEVNCVEK